MTHFSTDRQIVERIIIPTLAIMIVGEIRKIDNFKSFHVDEAYSLLYVSLLEPVKNLTHERAKKLIQRAQRVSQAIIKPFAEESALNQYLIIAYWIIELAEKEIISVGADSSFSKAWDILADAVSAGAEGLDEIEKRARAGAIQITKAFNDVGYFQSNR